MNRPSGFAVPVLREHYLCTTLGHRDTELCDEERARPLGTPAARPEGFVAGDLLAVGWDTPGATEKPRTQMLFLLLDPTLQRPAWVRADQLA